MDLESMEERSNTLIREAELLKNGRNVHKLNTAVSSVKGWLWFLKNPPKNGYSDKQAIEYDVLLKQAMSRLMDEILAESRIQWKTGKG